MNEDLDADEPRNDVSSTRSHFKEFRTCSEQIGCARVTLKPFVNRVLKDATETGADAVIFQIDTFGGRVDIEVVVFDQRPNAQVIDAACVLGKIRPITRAQRTSAEASTNTTSFGFSRKLSAVAIAVGVEASRWNTVGWPASRLRRNRCRA